PYAAIPRRVELPAQTKQFDNPRELVQALVQQGIYVNEKDPELELWKNRVQSNAVYATFAHPNSFAGYLALLLPAAVGWTLAARRLRTQDRRSREDGGSEIENGGSKIEDRSPSLFRFRSSILDARSSARIWLGGG